jgi:hypothetical protein
MLLHSSRTPPRLWKLYCFSGSQKSSSGFTGFDWWPSSKISSAGSKTEHWWRCS